jgi:HAD superfamily hydrolase (TIGR01490 family)
MRGSTATIWAFFDLDGTLFATDSFLPFLFGWQRRHPKRLLHILLLPLNLAYFVLARKDRSYIKSAFLTAFMRGAKRSDIQAFVRVFWDGFLSKYQNDAVVNRLHWHHEKGHPIYIVTGSFDFYVEYLRTIWPVEGVIATRAEWKDNILTGKLVGKNCRGIEKIERIENELGIHLKNVQYYAYSDSEIDRPLLEYADYPMTVKSGKIQNWNGRSA